MANEKWKQQLTASQIGSRTFVNPVVAKVPIFPIASSLSLRTFHPISINYNCYNRRNRRSLAKQHCRPPAEKHATRHLHCRLSVNMGSTPTTLISIKLHIRLRALRPLKTCAESCRRFCQYGKWLIDTNTKETSCIRTSPK
jgi:hypothetical protein